MIKLVSLEVGHGVVDLGVEIRSEDPPGLVEGVELPLLEPDVLGHQLDLGDLLVMGEVLGDRCLLEVVAGGLHR